MRLKIGSAMLSAVVLCTGCGVTGAVPGPHLGAVARYDRPTGDFADVQGDGFSIAALGELRLTSMSVLGEAAWTRFSGLDADDGNPSTDALSFVELSGGLRLYSGPFHASAQAGVASGDDHEAEWFIRPGVGIGLMGMDVLAQYRYGGDAQWWSLGLGIKLF